MQEIYVPLAASLSPAEYAMLVKDVFLTILYFRSQNNHHPLSKSSTEANSAADLADRYFSTAITPKLFFSSNSTSTAPPVSLALVIGSDILNPLEVYRINLSTSPPPPPLSSSSTSTTTTTTATTIMKKVIRDLTILQSLPLPSLPSKPTNISLLRQHQHTTVPPQHDFIVQRQFNPHGSKKTKVCINLVMGHFSSSSSDENNNSNKDEEEGGVWLQCATSFKGSS